MDAFFHDLSRRHNLESYLGLEHLTNIQAKNSQDTLGLTIYTDDVKEVTSSDYTSYTMRMATPDADSTKFYNITFEDKSGTSGVFVTKYIPTEQWLTNKEQAFEGSAKTYRITDDITHVIDDADGGNSNGGIINGGTSNEYPDDCDGWIETNVI